MEKELPACPVETTLLLIGEKWKVLILRELLGGTKRFGELKKAFPSISQKMLTQQLRAMESDRLIDRKVYAEVPPKVEYTLTETGRSLKIVLDAMVTWGRQYQQDHKQRSALDKHESVHSGTSSRRGSLAGDGR